MTMILILAAAYLLGSIPFGYLVVKAVKGIDVRTQGSGNIGMTNVWRVAGAPWGILTLALDAAKGVLAVWLGQHFFPTDELVEVSCGLLALLGNVFSVFMKFKGGKGIGVSVGVFFWLLPIPSAVGTLVFALALFFWRMISVGSLLAFTTMMSLTFYFERGLTWLSGLTLVGALVVWWSHRQNIKRILAGTENKIGSKSKAKKGKGK
jgi:glycerol-3-phosphate acyltransferase PlsY